MILDELCELTGWHRDHARKALRQAGWPREAGHVHLDIAGALGAAVADQAAIKLLP